MPAKAKIFLVEDDFSDRRFFRKLLEQAGHEVLIEAGTLEAALCAINSLASREINVAVLDGNLTRGVGTGADGEQLVARIRAQHPAVKIVGLSKAAYRGTDSMIWKHDVFDAAGNSNPLGEAVTSL